MAFKQVIYGGWVFGYHKMEVTQVPRMAENGIDQAGIRYHFKIKGWFSAKTESDFALLITQTKAYLATPRKNFLVQWSPNGTDWSKLYEFDSLIDTVWGPLPGPLVIETISGGKAALFTWDLDVEAKQCWDMDCNPFLRPSDVLSISRKYQFDIGPDGKTTRIMSGRLEVAAHSVVAGFPADSYRPLVNVDTPENYKRQSSNYVQSMDGRFLDYSVTDMEVDWTLPAPITTGQATWSVSTEGMSAMAMYRLSGTFTAPPQVSKSAILDQILQLASNRFPDATEFGMRQIEKTIQEDVYGNSVSFTFVAHGSIGTSAYIFDPTSGYATFGTQPPNSNGSSFAINTYGGSGTGDSGVIGGIVSPYDACYPVINQTPGWSYPITPPEIPATQPTGTNDGGSSAPPNASSTESDGSIGLSSQQKIAPWTIYRETISWEIDNGFKLFYPKSAGAAPIVQQVRNPKMYVIQVGYARNFTNDPANAPQPQAPIYNSNTCVLHKATIAPSNPKPIGDTQDWNEYAIEWNYVMEITGSFATGSSMGAVVPAVFPIDPRRVGMIANTSGTPVPNVPSGLIKVPS